MTELVSKGYVYIAQPPLYKVKKKSKEMYVETEAQMNEILLDMACEDTQLKRL